MRKKRPEKAVKEEITMAITKKTQKPAAEVKKAEKAKKPAEVKKAAPAEDDPLARSKGLFEIKRAGDGRYYFNLRAANTQVIASSQMYSSLSACKNGIASVAANAPIAPIEDQTLSTINQEKFPKFQIMLDKGGKYRFNLWAANGQNILSCTQGYAQKSGCKNGIASVVANAKAPAVLEED